MRPENGIRQKLAVTLGLLLILAIPAAVRGAAPDVKVSPDQVEVGAFFRGHWLTVEGTIPAGAEAVMEVVGTSLLQILFTCINVTIMQSYTNHTVDMVLAIILLLGSTVGAQFGVRLSRRLKADQLKILLASIVLLVMVQMLASLIISPDLLLAHKGGH